MQVHPEILETYHRYRVAIEQDLIQFRDPLAIRSVLVLGYIVQKHIDEVIKSQKGPHDLLIVLHDDVNPRADALVHEFCGLKVICEQLGGYFIPSYSPKGSSVDALGSDVAWAMVN